MALLTIEEIIQFKLVKFIHKINLKDVINDT